jgi:hypothetical protein
MIDNEVLDNQAEDEDFYLMANLYPKHTGLPFVVWIQERGGAKHDVRVKVSPGPRAMPGQFISVAIRPDVHVIEPGELRGSQLAQLKAWIEKNRAVIMEYWEGTVDTVDMVARLKKI